MFLMEWSPKSPPFSRFIRGFFFDLTAQQFATPWVLILPWGYHKPTDMSARDGHVPSFIYHHFGRLILGIRRFCSKRSSTCFVVSQFAERQWGFLRMVRCKVFRTKNTFFFLCKNKRNFNSGWTALRFGEYHFYLPVSVLNFWICLHKYNTNKTWLPTCFHVNWLFNSNFELCAFSLHKNTHSPSARPWGLFRGPLSVPPFTVQDQLESPPLTRMPG